MRTFKHYRRLDFVPTTLEEEQEHHKDMKTAKKSYNAAKSHAVVSIPVPAFGGKRQFNVRPVPDYSTQFLELDYAGYGRQESKFSTVTTVPRSSVLFEETIWYPSNDKYGVHVPARCTITSQSGVSNFDLFSSKWPGDCITTAIEADWPCKQELKFEGDDRVATDIKHGRFMPVPRKRGNETVAWQHLMYLEQHQFDAVHNGSHQMLPDHEEVIFRDLEVGFDGQDPEILGLRLLGKDLMDALDPEGIYQTRKDF